MKELIPLMKKIEIEMRSNNGNISSELIWSEISDLSDWSTKIISDFKLRVKMYMENDNINMVWRWYDERINKNLDFKEKKIDLLIGLTKRDQRDTILTDVYNRLVIPTGITYDTIEVWGMHVETARNFVVEQAMKKGAKYLFFIDDDMILPNNTLLKLFDLASRFPDRLSWAGEYKRKIEPCISAHGNLQKIEDDIYETDLLAMGCTLIDIETVSSKVPFPLFWAFGAPDGFFQMGEDAFYTQNLKYYTESSPVVDMSIKCLHYDKQRHRVFGERDKDVTYATNGIFDLDQFERMRVPDKFPLVNICIPTRSEQDPIAINLNNLKILRGYRSDVSRVWDMGVAEARTALVKDSLAKNADYIFFIDDDIVLPDDALVTMIEFLENNTDYAAISGDYPLKGKPKHSVHLQLDENGMVNELHRIKDLATKFTSNWLIGFGCVLIRAEFFKGAREPWFKVHSKNSQDVEVNEDAHCCELMFINGYKISVDRDISCIHVDYKEGKAYSLLTKEKMQNIKWANHAWLNELEIL